MHRMLLAAVTAALSVSLAHADDYALTVYSTAGPGAVAPEQFRPTPGRPTPDSGDSLPGYAVVRQDRDLTLESGRQQIRFTDVAALIDPTTVTFRSLTDPDGTHVLEQNYQFDLVGTDRLLERYLGQTVTVEQHHGDSTDRVRGKLLGTSGGLILKRDDGSVVTLNQHSNVSFPELPGGLITRPTLVWDLTAAKAGRQQTRVSYQTGGMTWWADYNAVLDESGGCSLGLSAWVSLINRSGAGYPDARLKLVAGDVHRAQRPQPRMAGRLVMSEQAVADRGFEEKPFFEYHLYTLPRRTSLPDNSTKQIELFPPVSGIHCDKELVYEPVGGQFYLGDSPSTNAGYGQTGSTDVNVFLRFGNDEKAGLGVPLPAGRVRVNQLDPADGSLEFIGEDAIDHTPKDEDVLVRMGNAFDVVGERTQTEFNVNTSAREMTESFRISLRNHKDRDVSVIAREHLYRWSNWEIVKADHDWEKRDSRTIHFPVDVPANGETTINYTVRYTW